MKKTKTRTKAKPSTTALARITDQQTRKIVRGVTRRLEQARPEAPAEALTIGESEVGAVGLMEIKLTEAEEKVLAKPIDASRVLIKPSGQPYYPHPEYTRWLNEAFGRLGWAIVPRAKPQASGLGSGARVLVTVPYILYIHQTPAAFALGEQEFYEKNNEQTYGDAVEATTASALRRCMKRLGIGLELWDRAWLDAWTAEHAVCVKCDTRDGPKDKWRLISAKPFYNEVGPDGRRQESASARTSEPAQRTETKDWHQHRSAAPISEAQHRRLWACIYNSGRDDKVEIKPWLQKTYGVDLSHKYENEKVHVSRKDYDTVIAAIEAEGPLPAKA